MENKYNEIVLSRDAFEKFTTDIGEQRQLLWEKVTQTIYTLTLFDYICVVYDDDIDVIVIQFEHNENKEYYGIPNPKWISEDEYEEFLNYKNSISDININEE